jgi:hypothetical protein
MAMARPHQGPRCECAGLRGAPREGAPRGLRGESPGPVAVNREATRGWNSAPLSWLEPSVLGNAA